MDPHGERPIQWQLALGALMQWRRRGAVLVAILTVAACGNEAGQSSALEDARADLRSRAAYHISAVVGTPGPLASALDGTYEIDFEKPDRYRTVRMVGSEEAGRTVAIGTDLFGSNDEGRSWQHAAIGTDGGFSPASLLGLLDTVCVVKEDGSRLRLEVRSRTHGCEKPLPMAVEVQGGVVRSIETKMPTDLGSISVTAQFDFDSAVEPIVPPATAAP